MKATSTRRLVDEPALAWSQRLEVEVEVEVGGAGTVAAAGVVLPSIAATSLRYSRQAFDHGLSGCRNEERCP